MHFGTWALGRERKADLWKFKASLVHRAVLRPPPTPPPKHHHNNKKTGIKNFCQAKKPYDYFQVKVSLIRPRCLGSNLLLQDTVTSIQQIQQTAPNFVSLCRNQVFQVNEDSSTNYSSSQELPTNVLVKPLQQGTT